MPCGRSFGLAHAAEQRVHVGPEPLPLLAFLLRQPREGVRGADAGEVAVGLPVPQPLPGLSVGPRVTVAERLAPPTQVLSKPVEGLSAPEGAFLVVQRARLLAVTTTR